VILELAHLVASQRKAREIVALDEEVRPSSVSPQRPRQSRDIIEWCGEGREVYAWQARQLSRKRMSPWH